MNNDIKKFLRKICVIPAVIICFIVFGVFIISNQYSENYNASIIDKAARLKSINEPKIILVGHSSLAFGMNSKMLQDAINMPVVNLGLHGALGNAFHENIAKLNINSGDLVILCPSDFADDDQIESTNLAWITIEYHWDLYDILRTKDYIKMITGYPSYWIKSFYLWITSEGNQREEGAYSRRAFNEFGDVAIRPAIESSDEEIYMKSVKKIDGSLKFPSINDTCINRLNEYNKYIKSRGATLLVAGYPIAEGEFTPSKERFDKFQQELASRLDCEIISNYRDYFIPYKYFYDFTLHLDEEGVIIRTQQLIKDIKRWQNKQNKTGNL